MAGEKDGQIGVIVNSEVDAAVEAALRGKLCTPRSEHF